MSTRTHRSAAILSIGDELTLGQKLDSNSKWLSDQLVQRGVMPKLHMTVSDGIEELADRFASLARDYDLVISTGGLGPTEDDMTRRALAQAMNEELVEDEASIEAIAAHFAKTGRTMPETNRVQAMRPASARCLPNDRGTAPGLYAELGGADVFCLPGPPSEMHPMFERDVVPALRAEGLILTRVMPTVGLGESTIAGLLGDLMDRARNPVIGTTASSGVVSIRIRYEGPGREEGERMLDDSEARVREVLGDHIITNEDKPIAQVVLEMLTKEGQTIATVESCTGGMIGQVITGVPGSSGSYFGGFVTYTNAMKTCCVRVEQSVLDRCGAVSRECCEQMARGGREAAGADYALAVTGIAGPSGGTAEKPVGTVWIGAAGPGCKLDVRRFLFTGDREQIRRRTVTMGLAMVWMMLAGKSSLELLWQTDDAGRPLGAKAR